MTHRTRSAIKRELAVIQADIAPDNGPVDELTVLAARRLVEVVKTAAVENQVLAL